MEMKDVVPGLAEVLLDPSFTEAVALSFNRPVWYKITKDDCPKCSVHITVAGVTSSEDFVAKLHMGMLGVVSASVAICTPKKARGAKHRITVPAVGYRFVFDFVGRHIIMCVQPERRGVPKVLEKWRD